MSRRLRCLCALALVFVSSLAFASSSQGALLGLTLGRPDMTIGKVNVIYNPGTNEFTATGVISMLDYVGGANPDYSSGSTVPATTITGTFVIKAMIDSDPTGPTGGKILNPVGAFNNKMVVTGAIGTGASATLLEANLVQVGANTQTIEFRFNNVTGTLASQFKAPLGVIMSTGNPSKPFASNFDPTSVYNNKISATVFPGTADIASEVPEPTSLAVWSLTAISLFALRGYRSRRQTGKSVAC